MGLRGDHVIGDSRQEHVDNHNLLEVFVRDYDPVAGPKGDTGDTGPQGPPGSGDASVPQLVVTSIPQFVGPGDVAFDNVSAVYRALRRPVAFPPDDADAWELVGPLAPGLLWAADTAYATGDLVITAGSGLGQYTLWRALADSDSPTSPPTADWEMVASGFDDPTARLRTLSFTIATLSIASCRRTWTLPVDCAVRGVAETFLVANLAAGSVASTACVGHGAMDAVLATLRPGWLSAQYLGPPEGPWLGADDASYIATKVTATADPNTVAAASHRALYDTVESPATPAVSIETAEAPDDAAFDGLVLNLAGFYLIDLLVQWAK